MKKSKFTKVISFIVALVIVFSTVTLNSSGASTYSTVTSSHECQKTLCFKDLMVSGLYGDPNETVDSSIPYLGGMTYIDIYKNHQNSVTDNYLNQHLLIIYCPKYDYSDSGLLKHTMTLMFGYHGYTTVSYSQYNAYNHYANKKCDHSVGHDDSDYSELSQELCENESVMLDNETLDSIASEYLVSKGCGNEASFLETHTWSYGSWYSSGSGYHTRSKTCIYCGYSTTESDNHSTTTSEWVSSSDSEHKRDISCSTCGYITEEAESHSFIYDEWTDNGDGNCIRTKTCSVCGYSNEENQSHNYEVGDWYDYGTDNPYNEVYDHTKYHQRDGICANCGNETHEHSLHEFEWINEWTPLASDPTRHSRLDECTMCGYRRGFYYFHQYGKTVDYYEVTSETQHTEYKNCTDCGYANGTLKDHTFVDRYEQYSEDSHKHIQTCACGYQTISYGEHKDSNSDCYCDDCGYLMTMFSVTVPTTMNFTMSKTGEIFSADNVKIINNSTAAVTVKQMNINAQNGWSIVPYDTNIAIQKVDSKIIGLKLNDVETVGNSKTEILVPSAWNIEKGASLPLSYDAVVSATSTPITDEQVLNVVFVVDWR